MRSGSILFIVLVLFSCNTGNNRDSVNDTTAALKVENSDLKIGTTVNSTLQKHLADTFRLNLDSGAIVYGFANQVSVDVDVALYRTDGKKLGSFDGPSTGAENFWFRIPADEIYKMVVSPFEEGSGDYTLVLGGAEYINRNPEGRIEQLIRIHLKGIEKTPGGSIAVAQDGKILYSQSFGYADLEYDIKNSPQTIFHIASVSKQFTAFAIAMLADQGKLSLHDDIRKYLPELNDFGTVITIDHLVHHTSGLRDQWNLLGLAGWRLDDVITQKQIMRLISRQKELNFQPGDEMLYCNTGFTLMAEIVSRVTGQSFAAWTRQNIFDPLDMKNTVFYDDHEMIVKNRAYSYHNAEGGFKKSVLSYANAGATSLFTTVEDLSLWADNFDKMKVGNPKIMEMMERCFILNKGDTTSYAFGQSIGKYKGLKTISHGGGDAGYRTYLLRFPDQHFAVSVFSNLASFNPASIAFEAADAYLGDKLKEEPKVEQPTPSASTPPKEEPFDASKVNLDAFTGKFYSPELETTYSFVVLNDTLTAHHQRHDPIKFLPSKKDKFTSGTWFMGNVEFNRDGANKIKGLKVSSGRVRNLQFVRQ